MAGVSLKGVSKVYSGKKEQFEAVRDFNLDIKNREYVVLVGPSGCGKSTTLRMIAGLEEITGGEMAIVRDPKAFLLDEPLSNLDAKLRTQMRTEISTLHKTLGSLQ